MQRLTIPFFLFSLVNATAQSIQLYKCKNIEKVLGAVVTPKRISAERSVEIRQWLELGAINYFLENTHPVTGMTLDRAPKNGNKSPGNRMASLAATGFSMTVLSDAASKGVVDSKLAQKTIENSLNFALTLENHKGWLPHFVDWETGKNTHGSEYSTIDTGLFIAGALFAVETFPANAKIKKLADTLYARMDFITMMTNGGKELSKRTLSMGWDSNTKDYITANWDTYSEHMILQVLGFGHPLASKQLPPKAWTAWKRQTLRLPEGNPLVGADLPLFAHQYPWLWLNPHEFKDSTFDPFQNSKIATERDRGLSFSNSLLAPYGVWGLSASDGPAPEYYKAYRHGDGKKDPGHNNGTVCPGCVAGSMVYLPKEVLTYLDGLLNSTYKDKVTGRYGFVDAFNPSKNWAAEDTLGITVGPAYLSSRNLEDGAIWNVFQKIPAIQKGTRLKKPKPLFGRESTKP